MIMQYIASRLAASAEITWVILVSDLFLSSLYTYGVAKWPHIDAEINGNVENDSMENEARTGYSLGSSGL